ncbi:M56 family metallopeptidase [Haliscomenobacter sp.]|uniref:M56 family metallopeptidase n=1 Tax=Haliscomenobacter sp. TaxID=2717303 RepID=UPI003BACE9CD
MESNYTDALIYATGWTVVHSLWQALTIALVLSIILISTPRRLAHWRYSCAGVALLLVLLVGGATFYHYFQQAMLQVESDSTSLVQFTEVAGPATESFWQYWQGRFTDYFNQHLPMIVTVWLCGLAFFMLRMMGGLAYIRQLRYQGTQPVQEEWEEMLRELAQKLKIQRPVAILESLRIQSPVVIGHFKPLVLVPVGLLAGLSIDQVEAILAHELAHVYRRDYLLNLLQTLIEALFYFNPGVWWISSCIRIEREHCCDDIAVAVCQNNLEYAKALVSIKEMKQGFTPQLAMAARGKKKLLLTRIQRILQQPVNTSDMSEKIMVTGMLAFMLVCMNLKAERKLPEPEREKAAISVSSANSALPAANVPFDTLPEGKITIRTSRNGKKIEAKISDQKIQELIVDGKTIPSSEYNSYEETLNDIIASVPPPPPPPSFPKMPPPGLPGDVPPPSIPAPPKVPMPPKGNGYYYYHNGDDHIIIEGSKKGFGYQYKMKPEFKYNWVDSPLGFDRSIVIDGMDSTEVAFFRPNFSFRGAESVNVYFDSVRLRLDTAQMRKLKHKLGNVHIQLDELKHKLGDRQFHFEGQKFNMEPGVFNFGLQTPMPLMKMKGWGGSTRERIEQTLIGDELIKSGSRYTFELTDKYLKIDGNKMPEALFEKYRKIYEESTGIKLEGESKILLSN